MGSAQSQEQPEVVRIDRSEIPEEYKTVGVSSDVVRRVNAQARGEGGDAERLRDELARERAEKQRLREEMVKLSELQQRKVHAQSSPVSGLPSDIEERQRIFDETVERVQQKFFAYHRENVCADNEKEIMNCLRANPGMRWLYGCIAFLAIALLYFRPRLQHRKAGEHIRWTLKKSNASFDTFRYANCSPSTCLRSQSCMLDYGSLSVYIQPLLTIVDEVKFISSPFISFYGIECDGNVVTPSPSKEFYLVRSLLRPYSVLDPKQACIIFPGVDFLNLHRFPSVEIAHFVASMISERFYNVLIFTLIGQWKHTFRLIMAREHIVIDCLFSSVTPRHLYRHRLDISLPPLPGSVAARNEKTVTRNHLLLLMVNASTSFRDECRETFDDSKDVTVVTECIDQPWFTCDMDGTRVDWKNALQESKFVLIDERMPLFKIALYRALELSVIPVISAPNHMLPFSDYIDWNLISLRPSSLSRVLDVVNSLDETKVQSIRSQMRTVFESFSTLEGIVNMTLQVLEARMLPLKTRTYEQWNKQPVQIFTLPHFEPATQLTLLAHSDSQNAKYTIELIRQLVSGELLSSVTVKYEKLLFLSKS
ncbi:exostosin family protein [Ancylostoma caninum]|uniref:Exostosin family protein n=1 Tax=Ancylostoma caninum TaxID=29170 RepID=A0A368FPI1_ANCCA|nr:exostosin family protein [Ancylostoma caninum]